METAARLQPYVPHPRALIENHLTLWNGACTATYPEHEPYISMSMNGPLPVVYVLDEVALAAAAGAPAPSLAPQLAPAAPMAPPQFMPPPPAPAAPAAPPPPPFAPPQKCNSTKLYFSYWSPLPFYLAARWL